MSLCNKAGLNQADEDESESVPRQVLSNKGNNLSDTEYKGL